MPQLPSLLRATSAHASTLMNARQDDRIQEVPLSSSSSKKTVTEALKSSTTYPYRKPIPEESKEPK